MRRKVVSKRGPMRMRMMDMVLMGLFAALTIVGAFLKLPIGTVAYTAQTFCVVMSGLVLGARRGALAQLVYILIGLLGAPVFSAGGGIGYVLDYRFGYLIGFMCFALLAGWSCDRQTQRGGELSFPLTLLGSLAGMLLMYICACSYAYVIFNVYLRTPQSIGFIIANFALRFVVTDTIWCVLASLVAGRLRAALPGAAGVHES